MTFADKPQLLSRMRTAATQRWRYGRAALRRAHALRAGLPERAEDILSSILNVSGEGVVVTGVDLKILLFSKGAEEIFGYRASEVLGRSLEILIPPEHREVHGSRVATFAAGAITSRRMRGRNEIGGLTKAGEVVPLEVGLSKLVSANGMIFTAIVRDVSERRHAETALAKAAADANAASYAKSAFLAAMSHEIRTPLNGVLGMAQAMACEDLPDRQRERLGVIRQSGEMLLAILNDLLDLSKIEAGKLELEETEFDLDALVGQAIATFAALATQKGLAFELRVLDRARGAYSGDPLRIRQILHNLISNAIKFTDAGWVKVTVGRRAGVLTFLVRDSGIGIPPERLSRLFEKFEQGDASTTRRFGGTGLGLAICRDLAELMGGTIGIESRVGRGAVFRVNLPLQRVVRRAKATSDQAASVSAEASSLRVLVAEDNPTNQLVIRTLLNQAGIAPTLVADGHAAVEAWAGGAWDLILMDVQMPEMDGPTAAAVIRAREAADGRARTPILALTANAMAHQVEEYRQAGMDGLIPKPIDIAALFAAIASATAD